MIVQSQMQRYSGSPRTFDTFAEEGYRKNAVTFRCIKLIADSASTIPIKLMQKKGADAVEITEHEILKLLWKPNPFQTYASFIQEFFSYYGIAGNSFLEALFPVIGTDLARPKNVQPLELWPLPPKFLSVEKN